MADFQEICYTRAPRLEIEGIDITSLGSMDTVMKTIQRVKPEIITISEAKLSCIETPTSPLKNLFEWLKGKGFKIEIGELVEDDHQAIKAIEREKTLTRKFFSEL